MDMRNYFIFGLCLFAVMCIPAVSNTNAGGQPALLKNAFAQIDVNGGPSDTLAAPSDPASPGASNSTDPSAMSDNSNIPGQNDTLDPGASVPDVSSDIAGPSENSTVSGAQPSQGAATPNQAVPEFGPLPSLILGASIVAALMIGQRALFRH